MDTNRLIGESVQYRTGNQWRQYTVVQVDLPYVCIEDERDFRRWVLPTKLKLAGKPALQER